MSSLLSGADSGGARRGGSFPLSAGVRVVSNLLGQGQLVSGPVGLNEGAPANEVWTVGDQRERGEMVRHGCHVLGKLA